MNLLLAAAAAPVHSFIVLFILVLLAIVLIGFVYSVATHFLPPPWPNLLVGALVVFVLLWLLLWISG